MAERVGIELVVDDKGSVHIKGAEEALKKLARSAQTGPRSVDSALKKASRAAQQFGRQAGSAFRTMEQRVFKLRNAVIALGAAFALKQVVAGIVEAGAAMQNFENSLTAVLNRNRDLARRMLAEIREFAARTPFETRDVVEAFVQLRAVGIKASTDTITAIGNAAAVFNRNIRDVTAGVISVEKEVLRRLGIILDQSGKQAVLTSGRMRIVVEKDARAIQQAVLQIWGDRFKGAIKDAESIWTGTVALFRSLIFEFQADIAEAGFLQFIIDQVTKLNTLITEARISGVWAEYARRVSDALTLVAQKIVDAGKRLVDFIVQNKDAIKSGILDFWRAFRDAMAVLLPLIPKLATAMFSLAAAVGKIVSAVPAEVAAVGFLVWFFGGAAVLFNPYVAGIAAITLAIMGLAKGIDTLINKANEAQQSGALESIARLSRGEIFGAARALGGQVPQIVRQGATPEILSQAKEILGQLDELHKQFVVFPEDVKVAERNLRSLVSAFEEAASAAKEVAKAVEEQGEAQQTLSQAVIDAREAFETQLDTLRLRVALMEQVAAGALSAAEAEDALVAATAQLKGITREAIAEFIRLRQEQRRLQAVASARATIQKKLAKLERDLTKATATESQKRIDIATAEMTARQAIAAEAFALGEVTEEELTDLVRRAAEARTEIITESEVVMLNLGTVITETVDQMVDAWIAGTLDIENAMEALERAGKGIMAKMFKGMIEEKLKFEDDFEVNFLKDLPGIAKQGAGLIGKAFSGIFGEGAPLGGVGNLVKGIGGKIGGLFGGGAGAARSTEGAAASAAGGAGGIGIGAAIMGIVASATGFAKIIKGDLGAGDALFASLVLTMINPGLGLVFVGAALGDALRKQIGGVGGRLAGAGLGAALGAAGGFLVGGPIGAVIGAIVGGIFGGLGGLKHTPTLGTQFRKNVINTLEEMDVVFADLLKSSNYGFRSAKEFERQTGISMEVGLNEFISRDFPNIAARAGARLFGLGAVFTAGSLGLGSERGKFGKVQPQRGLSSFANVIVAGLEGDERKIEAIIADTIEKMEITLGTAALALEELFPLFTKEGFEATGVTDVAEMESFLRTLENAVEGVVQLTGGVVNNIVNAATAQKIWNRFLEEGAVSAETIVRILEAARASFETLTDGIKAGIEAAIAADDPAVAFEAFAARVRNTVREAVLGGITEAFLASAAIENVLQPFFETMSEVLGELALGDIGAEDAADRIKAAWAAARGELELLAPVIDVIATVAVDLNRIFAVEVPAALDATKQALQEVAEEIQRLGAIAEVANFIQAIGGTGLPVAGQIVSRQRRLVGGSIAELERQARGDFDPAAMIAGVGEAMSALRALFNAEVAMVQERFAQERQAIELERERAEALRDEASALQDTLSVLQDQLRVQEALADEFQRFTDGFRDFRLELIRSTQPAAGITALLTEFRSLMPSALGGDAAAIARIRELMPLILQSAQQQFAPGTAQFMDIWNELLSATELLEAVTGDAAEAAATEAERLRTEVEGVQGRIDTLIGEAEAIELAVTRGLEDVASREEAALEPIRQATILTAQRLLDLLLLAHERAGSELDAATLFQQDPMQFLASARFAGNVVGAFGQPDSPFTRALDNILMLSGLVRTMGLTNAADLMQLVNANVGGSLGNIPITQFLADALAGFLMIFPNIRTLTDLETVVMETFARIFSGRPSQLLGFQSGGTVPGPFGSPQLAVVHGGETIMPAGGAFRLDITQTVRIDGAGHLTPEGEQELAARMERGQGELAAVISDTVREAVIQPRL